MAYTATGMDSANFGPPIDAVAGLINSPRDAIVVGLAQGGLPILSYHYGVQKYGRVRGAYFTIRKIAFAASAIVFTCFQLLPRQILHLFGHVESLYYEFSIRFMRIYMMMVLINGIQPVAANFLTTIGKARKGVFISLTRQVFFLLPLLLLLPLAFGIDGVVYAGPIADAAACIVAALIVRNEFKKMLFDEKD